MKIIVRPIVEPQREIDLTHRLASAIAEELWRLYGGNEQLNWMEAEGHLERLLGEARAEARETTFVSVGRAARAAGFRNQIALIPNGVETPPSWALRNSLALGVNSSVSTGDSLPPVHRPPMPRPPISSPRGS